MAGSKEKPNTAPLSGFRDILPEQTLPREAVLATISKVYQKYGFLPLETPILEREEVLTGKYGDEADMLMYRFEDHGKRRVALRYDHTVPLARVVAHYRGKLADPFKRYSIGPVFRGEKAQAGRYRQFTQFDADTVGTTSPIADAEIVAMMHDSMQTVGVDAVIRVNDRQILDALAAKAGLTTPAEMQKLTSGIIDKIDKVGRTQVLIEVNEVFGQQVAQLVEKYLTVEGTAQQKIAAMRGLLGPNAALEKGLQSLEQIFGMLTASGYSDSAIKFDPTIARGLSYYTGTIYETYVKGAEELGSVCSGGRYDRLISDLGGPDLPAVGTSIGVDRLFDVLQKLGKLEQARTSTRVLVTNFGGSPADYMQIASQLRGAGVPTEVAYDPKKSIGKQIQAADALGVPYAVIYGEDEKKQGVVQLRDLRTRQQETVLLVDLPRRIQELL